MSFSFTVAQKDELESLRDTKQFDLAYEKIVEWTTDSSGQPKPGVDEEVWLWFQGAEKVNKDIGSFSVFIREYTKEQERIRTGVSNVDMDAASDAIADEVLRGIVAFQTLPTLQRKAPERDNADGDEIVQS